MVFPELSGLSDKCLYLLRKGHARSLVFIAMLMMKENCESDDRQESERKVHAVMGAGECFVSQD
jgi:hypothetical protein